jgi:2Fe-2S ferredoxin
MQDQIHIVSASHGQTVLEAILMSKLEIPHSCGGMGTCGTCRVFVLDHSQSLSEPEELEREMAQDRGFSKAERLSCQARLLRSTRIKTP